MDPLTYRAAGVDIQAGDLAVRRIAPLAASTRRPEVLGGLGAFAAFCRVTRSACVEKNGSDLPTNSRTVSNW